jgi:hypothetical protein
MGRTKNHFSEFLNTRITQVGDNTKDTHDENIPFMNKYPTKKGWSSPSHHELIHNVCKTV